MGITVQEMLDNEAFKNFKILAGKVALSNQIQGVAIFDAPDAYQWTEGKEFVMTSGYLFAQNPNLFDEIVAYDDFLKSACFGIKLRFIKEIPERIIQLFDEIKIPLIVIPSEISWMDIINHLNVLIMNKNIRQFNIGNINFKHMSNVTYQGRKIHKILSNMEMELNFPAMVYDVENALSYYSSHNFKQLSKLNQDSDYWDPPFPHTQEILCDNIDMVRYRYHDEKFAKPYSWIAIPIRINSEIKAYFVLVEELGLLDYFDQFSVRLGFLLLQSMYEQVAVLRVIENRGFEKLITGILDGYLSIENIIKMSHELHLNEIKNYYMVVGKNLNTGISLYDVRTQLNKSLNRSLDQLEDCWSAILDHQHFILLVPDYLENNISKSDFQVSKLLKNVYQKIEESIPNLQLRLGVSNVPENIMQTKENYHRCQQTLEIGPLIFPNQKIITYKELGPLGWLSINSEELTIYREKFKLLLADKNSDELIHTLKMYLRFNMNYSQTAKEMYLHINTIRKRIDEVVNLLDMNLEDPIERLNLEILLELLY